MRAPAFIKATLAILVATVLTACGGGGDEASNNSLPKPTVSIADITVTESDDGTTTQAKLTVTLSEYLGPTDVDYATQNGTASTVGGDYTAKTDTLSFTGGSTSEVITIDILDDEHVEADETFTVVLSNPTNALLGQATATVTITNDDLPRLNDTGQTFGGIYLEGNNTTCTSNDSSGTATINAPQDCNKGRDVTHNDNNDGHAGFSFAKLDSNGHDLPADATQWRCVKDNVTGLVWEVKTDDDGIHDKDITYKWGGVSADSYGTERYDDWDSLVNGTNSEALCGFNNWRVPSIDELESLVNLNQIKPSIDEDYFPMTSQAGFWSSSAYTYKSNYASYVNFGYGSPSGNVRDVSLHVRLVRAGQ